jgi:hypothetical protein
MNNFAEFLGVTFFLFPFFVWMTNVFFDGLGYIRDYFRSDYKKSKW